MKLALPDLVLGTDGHLYANSTVTHRDRDGHTRGGRVFRNVRECLGADEVHGGFDLRRRTPLRNCQVDRDGSSRGQRRERRT